MDKVLTTMPVDPNISVSLRMASFMDKVLTTMPMETNRSVMLRMASDMDKALTLGSVVLLRKAYGETMSTLELLLK